MAKSNTFDKAKFVTFTNDFVASQFYFERPPQNIVSKTFKKGDTVFAKFQVDFGMNEHLVADGFDVTNAPLSTQSLPTPIAVSKEVAEANRWRTIGLSERFGIRGGDWGVLGLPAKWTLPISIASSIGSVYLAKKYGKNKILFGIGGFIIGGLILSNLIAKIPTGRELRDK